MKSFANILRITLIVLHIFLALSAFGGGIALLANLYAPPVDMLQGSPFSDYTIPGLALFVLVGGGALLAAILLGRRNKFASLSAISAGLVIMVFEFVEVLVIGSDPGAARAMQIIYFGIGTLIVAATMLKMFVETFPGQN